MNGGLPEIANQGCGRPGRFAFDMLESYLGAGHLPDARALLGLLRPGDSRPGPEGGPPSSLATVVECSGDDSGGVRPAPQRPDPGIIHPAPQRPESGILHPAPSARAAWGSQRMAEGGVRAGRKGR